MDVVENSTSYGKQNTPGLKFGTSGIRGLVSEMTDIECYINTKGFINFLLDIGGIRPGDNVCIAGDYRSSTPRIMAAVARAIEDAGCCVDNCGLIPTPALAYYASLQSSPCIMVTGSHIPDDRNGIKPYTTSGEVLKEDEDGILTHISSVRQQVSAGPEKPVLFNDDGMVKEPRTLPSINSKARQAYIQRYLDAFPADCLSSRTIVYYEHSAVGRDILPEIFEGLGAHVLRLGRSESFVPVDTENTTDEDETFFREVAVEYRNKDILAIISSDGDSDRPLIVDEQGTFHRGDLIGIVVCQYLHADFAAVPVSSNDAVKIQLEKDGITMVLTRIGSPYVIKAMNDGKAAGKRSVVGWEVNGGFLTGTDLALNGRILNALPTRDAALPVICVLLKAIEQNVSLSQMMAGYYHRFSQAGLINDFPVEVSHSIMKAFAPPERRLTQVEFEGNYLVTTDDTGFRQSIAGDSSTASLLRASREKLERYFSSQRGYDAITSINFIDGIRITFLSGDVAHLRPSGNAPQMRIYANAGTQRRADKIVAQTIAEPDGILRLMQRDCGVDS